ncbi:hypothetical protein MSIMFI_03216 [Mycobacterium simulans]|uniref:hypothetical protein n=1 Tax=Mycobacterium simulans TaxID=627089 RepID=UPI00174D3FF1|nr:hypothetical protein [Mycobacterium simulans]SON61699.1 hypothetical protein MSIMFI_03216 [Mycobacterium simulans]
MTRECPLQCRQASAPDHVDWAGLPVNLDLAFSPEQRDKVYAQHMMRKRWSQLRQWSRDVAQLCVCEIAFNAQQFDPDAANSTSGR